MESYETTSHDEETVKVKGCTCGSNLKSRSDTSCKTQEGRSSRCPCVRAGIACMEHCKCRKCSNTCGEKKFKLKSCRCGEERKTKDPGFVSCIDIEGKKNTRCPCFSTDQGCSERCRCFNCKNSFGPSIKIKKVSQPKRKKQLSSPQSLERPRGTQYQGLHRRWGWGPKAPFHFFGLKFFSKPGLSFTKKHITLSYVKYADLLGNATLF